MPPAMLWDLFCRVIDNFGDVGVCWRLATGLARRGQAVRLWIDDASALAWLAPQGAPGVQVLPWGDPPAGLVPGEVVVEAFGCTPPEGFVAAMAARPRAGAPAPVWLNLEYLSAEAYVARSHGLPSPQFSGPGAGLTKWFFYPGFGAGTGGLLLGDAALADPTASRTDARAWASARGWGTRPGERAVTLFCYANPALPGLLDALARQGPALLRVPPGPVRAQLDSLALPEGLRRLDLPYLPQPDFDRLLAGADLNIVRGEDSFVRAQLVSARPLLWQAYPQHDDAHQAKLGAFLDRYLAGWPAPLACQVRQAWEDFNSGTARAAPRGISLPELAAGAGRADPVQQSAVSEGMAGSEGSDQSDWAHWHGRWRQCLLARPDLCDALLQFVGDRRADQP